MIPLPSGGNALLSLGAIMTTVLVLAAVVVMFDYSNRAGAVELRLVDDEWSEAAFYQFDHPYNITLDVVAESDCILTVTITADRGVVEGGDFMLTCSCGNMTEHAPGEWISSPMTAGQAIVTILPGEGSLDLTGVCLTFCAEVA